MANETDQVTPISRFDRLRIEEASEFPFDKAFARLLVADDDSLLAFVLKRVTFDGNAGHFARTVAKFHARSRLDLITYVTSHTMTRCEREEVLRDRIGRGEADDRDLRGLRELARCWESQAARLGAA